VEQQGNVADRKCVRVHVPQGLLREAALWVRPLQVPTRLHLLELGRPDVLSLPHPTALRIDNISASGLRLILGNPQDMGTALELLKSQNCLAFLYLKLAQPLSAVEERPLALLLGVEPVALREENGQLAAAMNILYRGQPDRDDKSLTFFYVGKYPIRELAAWCDEVTLMDRAPMRTAARGLRMDRFLSELDMLLAQARAKTETDPQGR